MVMCRQGTWIKVRTKLLVRFDNLLPLFLYGSLKGGEFLQVAVSQPLGVEIMNLG